MKDLRIFNLSNFEQFAYFLYDFDASDTQKIMNSTIYRLPYKCIFEGYEQ